MSLSGLPGGWSGPGVGDALSDHLSGRSECQHARQIEQLQVLSGGQTPQAATAHLNAMNAMQVANSWPLSFSFGRALQGPALEAWRGEAGNVPAGQQAFHHRARCNSAATMGRYTPELESSGR